MHGQHVLPLRGGLGLGGVEWQVRLGARCWWARTQGRRGLSHVKDGEGVAGN